MKTYFITNRKMNPMKGQKNMENFSFSSFLLQSPADDSSRAGLPSSRSSSSLPFYLITFISLFLRCNSNRGSASILSERTNHS